MATLSLSALMVSSGSAMAASTDESNPVSNTGTTVISEQPLGISFNIMPMTVSSSIIQGQTNWHSVVISGFYTSMSVDLNWFGVTSNSLQLTIYSPDNSIYGPYYDGDDGSIDGRIHRYVNNPNGVPQGTWYFKVYGYSVTGTQSYTI